MGDVAEDLGAGFGVGAAVEVVVEAEVGTTVSAVELCPFK